MLARVYDIILDKSHVCCSKKEHGCLPDDIGTIYYTHIDELSPIADGNCELSSATPYHYNISQYPLKNELVEIKELASFDHNEMGPPQKYYLTPLSILQNTNSNSYINRLNAKIDTYFKANPLIKRLQPYEGDIMVQGRFGNSIRFGSTVDKNKVSKLNDWSNEGLIGNPITIISNGHETIQPHLMEEYEHTVENINNDKSSMWLCSEQQINTLQVASLHDLSYQYEKEEEKEEEQPDHSTESMPEDTQEDVVLTSTDPMPAEETQETQELSEFEDDETDYYDIAPTEEQLIGTSLNAILTDNYIIPDNINDSYLNEEIG